MSETHAREALDSSSHPPTTNLAVDPHPQSASPLFSEFPAEIRSEIFTLAVASFLDTSNAYPFDAYYFRLGNTAPKRTDLTLLRTCKQVYQETKELVWRKGNGNDEEVLWWGTVRSQRPPEHNHQIPELKNSPCQTRRQRAFATSLEWSRVLSIHIFTPVHSFSSIGLKKTFIRAPGLRPHTVKVTIRDTHASASRMPRTQPFCFPESVEMFILELGSIEHKEGELTKQTRERLDNKKKWRWKRLDDVYFELDEKTGVQEREWEGTAKFDYQRANNDPGTVETMKYLVKVLTFRAGVSKVK
ncbi:hypothetical protein BKA70DRAFT_1208691 [Coprinopsis sp. MPI-PUGE-AT-0042]|nr:hypothetical protein BKA70DRAFT_1208691 [Coprinopsis sp. MPI-PUGE-AT-0042]